MDTQLANTSVQNQEEQTRQAWVTPTFECLEMKKALSSAPPPYNTDGNYGYS